MGDVGVGERRCGAEAQELFAFGHGRGYGAARSAFIDLPYRLYRGDRHWVPPLRGDCRRLLSRRRNPFYEYGDTALFLARRGRQAVGRIAAVHNPRYNEVHGGHEGFFGQFECAEDPEAAAALVEAASEWLRERGLTSATGPVNFTTNDECGTLVEGFESPPTLLTAYNPPYYTALLEDCGFTKAKDLWSWEWDIDGTGLPERIARSPHRGSGCPDVTVRPADMRDLPAEAGRTRVLYNDAMSGNWGFQPISEREFGDLIARLKPWLRADLLLAVEVAGETAAVALTVPDMNRALAAAGGSLLPFGVFRVLRAARSNDRVRLVVLAVAEEHRVRGLAATLFGRLHESMRRMGVPTCEASWTLEDNDAINGALAQLGCRRTKTHRIWRRDL